MDPILGRLTSNLLLLNSGSVYKYLIDDPRINEKIVDQFIIKNAEEI